MAPPAMVMMGEGIGTMICSIKPPPNMAARGWVWIAERIASKILVISYTSRKKTDGSCVFLEKKVEGGRKMGEVFLCFV